MYVWAGEWSNTNRWCSPVADLLLGKLSISAIQGFRLGLSFTSLNWKAFKDTGFDLLWRWMVLEI